jgi:hypothetical protein
VVRVLSYRSRSPRFDSRRCQIFWEVVGLEQGPPSLISITEELLGRNSSGSSLENREYSRGDLLHWPHDILYPQTLALTSQTSGGRSGGIVRLGTKAMEFFVCIGTYSQTCCIKKMAKHLKFSLTPHSKVHVQELGCMNISHLIAVLKVMEWMYRKSMLIYMYTFSPLRQILNSILNRLQHFLPDSLSNYNLLLLMHIVLASLAAKFQILKKLNWEHITNILSSLWSMWKC